MSDTPYTLCLSLSNQVSIYTLCTHYITTYSYSLYRIIYENKNNTTLHNVTFTLVKWINNMNYVNILLIHLYNILVHNKFSIIFFFFTVGYQYNIYKNMIKKFITRVKHLRSINFLSSYVLSFIYIFLLVIG